MYRIMFRYQIINSDTPKKRLRERERERERPNEAGKTLQIKFNFY